MAFAARFICTTLLREDGYKQLRRTVDEFERLRFSGLRRGEAAAEERRRAADDGSLSAALPSGSDISEHNFFQKFDIRAGSAVVRKEQDNCFPLFTRRCSTGRRVSFIAHISIR